MKNKTQTPLERIEKVMEYYRLHGTNRENVNTIYRKILKSQIK